MVLIYNQVPIQNQNFQEMLHIYNKKTPKLPDRPTQQLPNTTNITPDIQQQEEIEAEQETPIHKENINKQKQNQQKIKKTLITYKTQNYKTFRNHNKMVDSEY